MKCCDCEFKNRCDETEKVLTSFVKCYKRDRLLKEQKTQTNADKIRSMTDEELEVGLLYDLKPLAAVYLDAGAMYGVDPVFLAAKDAEESGWGRYTAAPNNLGGWTSDDGGYMSFDSPEDYIYYSAEKMRELYLEEDGRYYNGTSLSDVCVAYNGNPEWAEHIESIMDDIYWRIEKAE